MIEVIPLSAHVGAEIRGVDVAELEHALQSHRSRDCRIIIVLEVGQPGV